MAFGRLDRGIGTQPMSEINVTPLVDVMPVLLVIFMITAPLMSSNLRLDLPASDAARPNDAPAFVTVGVAPDGRLHLDDEPVTTDALALQLAERAVQNPELEVHLRADKQVPYGRVAELIGLVQKAGLQRIGFVTEPTPSAN